MLGYLIGYEWVIPVGLIMVCWYFTFRAYWNLSSQVARGRLNKKDSLYFFFSTTKRAQGFYTFHRVYP
jgi:hypothetical protein